MDPTAIGTLRLDGTPRAAATAAGDAGQHRSSKRSRPTGAAISAGSSGCCGPERRWIAIAAGLSFLAVGANVALAAMWAHP